MRLEEFNAHMAYLKAIRGKQVTYFFNIVQMDRGKSTTNRKSGYKRESNAERSQWQETLKRAIIAYIQKEHNTLRKIQSHH